MIRKTRRRNAIMSKLTRIAAGLAMLAAVSLSGARPAASADDVTLRLHWIVDGSLSFLWLGMERGYFAEEGINLKVLEGKGSAISAQLVASKGEVFATADAGSMMQVRAKGGKIRSVMTVTPLSTLGVVFLKEKGLKTIKDLEGLRVGVTPGDSLTQLWPAVVAANKIDESKVRLTFMDAATKPIALMERRVDAILDGVNVKRPVLERKGFEPGWFLFSDYGVRLVSITLLAHEDTIATRTDLVRRLVKAMARSQAVHLQDPKPGIAALVKARPELDREVLEDQAVLGVETVRSGSAGRPLGLNDPADWASSVGLLRQLGTLDSAEPPTGYYTNDFVPRS